MNNETLVSLIKISNTVDCIYANTHSFQLKSTDKKMYQFELALPCDNLEVCLLMSSYANFELIELDRANIRFVSKITFEEFVLAMQKALTEMRSIQNLDRDLKSFGTEYLNNQLRLVKFLKNKYQFGLKETKILTDIYFETIKK